MWFDALIILGTCAAAVVFGFFVYWIIIKIQKTLRARQSNSMQGERQTPLTDSRDIEKQSLEHAIKKTDYRPDIQKEIDTETADHYRLNNGVPGASGSFTKKEDDDWLNADVEEVPTNVYKQQDDDWMNAGNDQSLETEDESSLNPPTTRIPEIQIEQDGSIINIIVTTTLNQDTKPDKKEENRRLNAETEEIPTNIIKQRDEDWLSAENDQPLETEVGSSLNHSPINQRELQVKQDGFLLNIAVSASKSQDIKSEQTVTNLKISPPSKDLPREVELPKDVEIIADDSSLSPESLQDIVQVKPEEETVDQSKKLMDEITVRSVESQGEGQKEDWGPSYVA
jgi:hypothetical protein